MNRPGPGITLPALALALVTAACAANRPSTERLLVLASDESARAAIDVSSVRGSTLGVRSVIYVVDYRQPQEEDGFTFDRTRQRMEFNCREHTSRIRTGEAVLQGRVITRQALPEDELEWEEVPPGTWVAAAMKLVCEMAS
ncbi:MAG TPA: surface-adhesin E family protein [Longimicrobium sp.]|jgi:hypothetical protein